MVSPNVDKMLKQAQSLTYEGRQKFIELLRVEPIPQSSQLDHGKIAESLLRKGIIRKIPCKPTPEEIAHFKAWKHIEVDGPAASETLIQERR